MVANSSPEETSSTSNLRGEWLGGIGLLVLIGFTWLPFSYIRMVDSPYILFWQLGFLSIGIWGVWMLRQFKVPFKPLGYGLDWAVGLIGFSLVISTVTAPFPAVAAKNLAMAAGFGTLLYVFRNWLAHPKTTLTWQRLWSIVPFVGIITAIISLILRYPELTKLRNHHPFGQHNLLGGYLILVIPLTVAFAISRTGWQRWLGIIGSFILLFDFYTTGSRGAIVGLTAVILASAVFAVLDVPPKRRKYFAFIVGLGIVVMIGAILAHPRMERIIQINPANGPLLQFSVDGQTQDRLFMWQAAGNMMREQPIFGVGLGNMSRVYNLYRPIEDGRQLNVQQLHSTPIQLLGELGIFGLVSIITFALLLVILWWRIYRQPLTQQQRILLYGTGASLIGYAGATLTDYQLETIGISSTIIFTLILLLSIADQTPFNTTISLSNNRRRLFSLGGIVVILICCYASFPLSAAMAFDDRAKAAMANNNNAQAYNHLLTASSLVPWNPTYHYKLGLGIINARQSAENLEQYQQLTNSAIKYFQNALEAAPYNPRFASNVGILKQEETPQQAQKYFSHALQLTHRSHNEYYAYYGWALNELRKPSPNKQKAITALSLQALIEPKFLTFNLWDSNLFQSLKEPVLNQTLDHLKTLLGNTPKNSSGYKVLYNNYVMVKWWHGLKLEEVNDQILFPVSQALLIAETEPDKAIEIINSEINSLSSQVRPLFLFRAWIKPDIYLDDYFNKVSEINKSNQEKSSIKKTKLKDRINNYRSVKEFILSFEPVSLTNIFMRSWYYTYRNNDLRKPKFLNDPSLREYAFIRASKMFPNYPRSLPSLEHYVERIKGNQLGLPHPTTSEKGLEFPPFPSSE